MFKKKKNSLKKLLTFVLVVFIIQGCLEIDHRGILPAPQVEVVEVIDQDIIEGLYDVAPKSIPIDFDCTQF